MIHFYEIPPVPVCVDGNLQGLCVCQFLAKMTAKYTQGGLQLSLRCQTMIEIHRPIDLLRRTVRSWKNKPTGSQISSINDTLSRCRNLYILPDYLCMVMQFIFVKYIIYRIFCS